MRENLGRKGRVSKGIKALFVALLAFCAIGVFSTSQANAAQNLKLTFNDSWIAIDALTPLAGAFHAIDPEDENPITVGLEGTLANDGTFNAPKSSFNFPDQEIDAGIAIITLKIKALEDVTGNYNRDTGAFSAQLPLGLNVLAPALGLSCSIAPLNIPLSTTGSKDFGSEETPDVKSGIPFTGGNGAVLGSWTGVGLENILDADPETGDPLDPQPEEGACQALLGAIMAGQGVDSFDGSIWLSGTSVVTGEQDACPTGTSGTFPDCQPDVCPEGKEGTPPNCTDKPQPAKVCKVASVKVGKAKAKAGKAAKVKVTVKNSGTAACKGKVTLKSNKKFAKVAKSVAVNVAAGKSQTKTVVVKTTKKAKGKVKITATFQKKKGNGVVTVQKAKKKKK